VGAAVSVSGRLVPSQGAGQSVEIQAEEVQILALSAPEFPLQKKRHSLEYLREIAHLRVRSNTFGAVFRLRNQVSKSIHNFFQERNFVWVHTPIISASDCEGAGEMFQVTTLPLENVPKKKRAVDFQQDFFEKKAGLTVSGQLNVETFCMGLGNVYTFGPTFRAENSNTSRHACEFWMVEPEIAFGDLNDDMTLAEAMVKRIISDAFEFLPEDMTFFGKFIDETLFERLQKVLHSDFEKMTYTNAIVLLEKADQEFKFPVRWGIDLQTEHEQYLCKKVGKPTFLINYPKDIKAFYMRQNDDGKTVAAMDLLVPEVGEIIGGSQREERLDLLEQRMAKMHLKKEDYWWYLDLRKYGGVKHAGFGLGLERMILYLSGMGNIRDVIPFPRTPGNCNF